MRNSLIISTLLLLTPAVANSQTILLEMTTSAQIGNTTIHPTSVPFTLDDFIHEGYMSAEKHAYLYLPNAAYTSVVPANVLLHGLIDFDLQLTVGLETLERKTPFKYSIWNGPIPPGAPGSSTSFSLQQRVVFDTSIGTFTVVGSHTGSNLLGQPIGASNSAPLWVNMVFAPIPEPSSLVLSFVCACGITLLRQRK